MNIQALFSFFLPFFLNIGTCVSQQTYSQEEGFSQLRDRMVQLQLAARDIHNRRVLQAMREVPRHLFVPENWRSQAYADYPLPIGMDQTISQPYIVALMTQLSDPKKDQIALEIGTGSGYQAAVLSKLVKEVYTIEIVEELAENAANLFQELRYTNVYSRAGDGYRGWPEKGPFDLILITAAAPRIPDPLKEQLAENGRLVMPLGKPGRIQQLIILEKKDGKIKRRDSIAVRFVPMTGEVQDESNP
jgi:protein-L-isoaspartate(D-aspartate) O-methyltransferase